ncbi:uncharacterized protein VP01_4226g4 [Puccinia sorghi]|uniref:Myb/SANT-like domain-containing protein n=1 Tax=Puccinia sorghi TaxID=27349 RepID=A0A0L6URE8_9BASI|nr:uncharacterized protein VP01_4226g4 [Puccinia sorghi]
MLDPALATMISTTGFRNTPALPPALPSQATITASSNPAPNGNATPAPTHQISTCYQSPNSNSPQGSFKTQIKQINQESPQNSSDTKKLNHMWTSNQKMALLTYLIEPITLGKGTDNGNLKAEGWMCVAKQMHD